MTGLTQLEQNAPTTEEEPDLIRLAIRIFDERERSHLSQILSLAAQRSPGKFVEVAAAQADVVFVNPDEPGAAVFIRNALRGKKPVPVIYGGEPERGLPWLGKPARSKEVLDLIATLPAFVAAELPASSVSAGSEEGDDQAILIPTHDFAAVLNALHGMRRREQPCVIAAGAGEILIDPRPGIAYVPSHSAGDRLVRTYSSMASLGADAIRSIPRASLIERLASFRHEAVSLEELGWSLAFLARPREPAPDAVMKTRLRLRHWPNFARLEHNQLHLVWAGMMIRQPLTISRFDSAAHLRGLLPLPGSTTPARLPDLLVSSDQVRGTVAQSDAMADQSSAVGHLQATTGEVGKLMTDEFKIVITGCVGSGKSTAIQSISDIPGHQYRCGCQ
jgi:hypothetical protein